jgi:hypothetical protein
MPKDRWLRQTDRVGDRLRGQPIRPELVRQPQGCGDDLLLSLIGGFAVHGHAPKIIVIDY